MAAERDMAWSRDWIDFLRISFLRWWIHNVSMNLITSCPGYLPQGHCVVLAVILTVLYLFETSFIARNVATIWAAQVQTRCAGSKGPQVAAHVVGRHGLGLERKGQTPVGITDNANGGLLWSCSELTTTFTGA